MKFSHSKPAPTPPASKKIKFKFKLSQFLSVVLSVFLLGIAINLLLTLPSAVKMTQASFAAVNIPNNALDDQSKAVEKISDIVNPPQDLGLPPPSFSANSVLVLDVDSNQVIFGREIQKRVSIASTTKIMTALVASSYFKSNQVLEVLNLAGAGGSSMGLNIGEKLSFRSLLYGMLLNSGNDAAFTIAQNYPGGVVGFVDAMNKKAADLNLVNTHFTNPAGFDADGHYSSAFDLSVIATEAIGDGTLARIVSTKQTSVASLDKTNVHRLENLNKLLKDPDVLGIKTGTTPQAKENLVTLINKNNHQVIIVLLGSDDRFSETEKLIDWTYSNFKWD